MLGFFPKISEFFHQIFRSWLFYFTKAKICLGYTHYMELKCNNFYLSNLLESDIEAKNKTIGRHGGRKFLLVRPT